MRLPDPPARWSALLREHQRLLTRIKLKKKERQRLSESLQSTLTELIGKVQPVLVEIERLDQQVHELFAELLTRKRQSRGVRATVRRVYQSLQDGGLLSPQGPEDESPDMAWEEAKPPPGARFAREAPPAEAGSFSAPRPAGGATGQSLRSLFHRLARALHPDQVQQEDEKARRTEAMKEITRAYQTGDVARLLDLERTWQADGALPAPSDELERRCAALARTNEALRAQLDQLSREVKQLRRSPQAQALSELQRAARVDGQDVAAWAVDDATEHRDYLREILDFVQRFRDGKIDLEEFRLGPESARDVDEGEDLVDFLDLLVEQSRAAARRNKGRRSARAHYASDIPL